MSAQVQTKPFRVGVTLDLTWNLKRHTDIFAGVVGYAQQHEDWQCIIDDFAADSLKRHKGRARLFDGIIGRISPELAEIAQRRKIPLVNVWFSSPVKNVPAVFSESIQAGEWMAEHLLSRGIRHFLCLIRRSDAGELITARRFEQCVKQEGAHCDTLRVSTLFAHSPAQWKKTKSLIQRWLQNNPAPVGVFAGVDMMARFTAQICSELGLRVPQDAAIVGGYNEPTICLYPEPTLTSIEYGLEQVGYEAAGMLHELMMGSTPQSQVVMVPPRELIVRQSSDFVYVDEPIVSTAMQFIAQHARRAIGVGDVAKAAGCSRRTLETRFQQHLGRTVAAEIRRVRIEQARRLLASSDESIAQIARLTGLGTPQQFSRVFGREVGSSPRQYRNQFKAGSLQPEASKPGRQK